MLWCCCGGTAEIVKRAYYGQWHPGDPNPTGGITHVADYPDRNVETTSDYLRFSPGNTFLGTVDDFNSGMLLVEGVTIPQGATVSAASLTLAIIRQGFDNGGKIRCKIRGWATDDCPPVTTSTPLVWPTGVAVDNEPRTVAETARFVFFDFTANTDPGIYYLTTPDLSAIVNEIVARPGWQAGNSMMFFIEQEGSTSDVSPFFFNLLQVYVAAGGYEDVPFGPTDSTLTYTLGA